MPMSSKAFLEATRARQAEEAQAARMARYDAHMKQQRAKKRLRNEMRDALDTELKDYVPEADSTSFKETLQSTDDWLYSDEGANETKKVYQTKMDELTAIGGKIEARQKEYSERPAAAAELIGAVEEYKSIANCAPDDAMYGHLEAADRDALRVSACTEKEGG